MRPLRSRWMQRETLLVTGAFAGYLDLGAGQATANGIAIFLAKLSGLDGSHLWSKYFPGSHVQTLSYGVAVDGSGSVLITGYMYSGGIQPGSVDFGGGPLPCVGDYATSGFVAKFSGVDGSHIWSKGFGCCTGWGQGTGVAVDPSGNVLVTGEFGGTVDFGGGPLTSVPNPEGGPSPDIFLLKLHP